MNCDKFAERVGFKTQWTVELGARQVFDVFERYGLTLAATHRPGDAAPAANQGTAHRMRGSATDLLAADALPTVSDAAVVQ